MEVKEKKKQKLYKEKIFVQHEKGTTNNTSLNL